VLPFLKIHAVQNVYFGHFVSFIERVPRERRHHCWH